MFDLVYIQLTRVEVGALLHKTWRCSNGGIQQASHLRAPMIFLIAKARAGGKLRLASSSNWRSSGQRRRSSRAKTAKRDMFQQSRRAKPAAVAATAVKAVVWVTTLGSGGHLRGTVSSSYGAPADSEFQRDHRDRETTLPQLCDIRPLSAQKHSHDTLSTRTQAEIVYEVIAHHDKTQRLASGQRGTRSTTATPSSSLRR